MRFPCLPSVATLLMFCLSVPVFAQEVKSPSALAPSETPPGGSPPVPSEGAPQLTPEQQAEFSKALQQDAAANAKSSGAGTQAPPAPLGFALQSLNPDLSFIGDVALAAFSAERPQDLPALQAGGHDPQKTGFHLQQLELSVSKAVDPYFRFDANLVFNNGGVEIEEAYATTLGLPYGLQARIGKFLTRFGRLNATHPHTWDFVDQPFMLSRLFGGEGNRGLGFEVSWLAPTPWYAEVVASVTEAQSEGATRSFIPVDENTEFNVVHLTDFDNTLALKQFFALSDDVSLMWGLSFAVGPNPNGPRTFSQLYGTDLYLKYRPLTEGDFTVLSLQAEGYFRVRQTPGDALLDVGGYAYGFWRFQPNWGTALRYEYGSPASNRAGTLADDYLDPFWLANRHRLSANLTFWPTEFSRIRLQGSVDFLGWQDRPNLAAFLAFEFSVGAHGAHKF